MHPTRSLICVLMVVVVSAPAVHAQEADDSPRVRVLIDQETGTNHHVGGVTRDAIGNLYVADFMETVWKIELDGTVTELASDLYGASGNVVDGQGYLLQNNFYGSYLSRIGRDGTADVVVDEGLQGPVGITVHPTTSDLYVVNCNGNRVSRIAPDFSSVETFSEGELFNCPNGLAFDSKGNLYVVNFSDNRLIRIDSDGNAEVFATITEKGLGHIYIAQDRIFVTAFHSHEIYEVDMEGAPTRLFGTGERGLEKTDDGNVQLSWPNGLVVIPAGNRIYFIINEFVHDSLRALPPRSIVRSISIEVEP